MHRPKGCARFVLQVRFYAISTPTQSLDSIARGRLSFGPECEASYICVNTARVRFYMVSAHSHNNKCTAATGTRMRLVRNSLGFDPLA